MRDPATFETDQEREGFAAFQRDPKADWPYERGTRDYDLFAHGFGCAETDGMGWGE